MFSKGHSDFSLFRIIAVKKGQSRSFTTMISVISSCCMKCKIFYFLFCIMKEVGSRYRHAKDEFSKVFSDKGLHFGEGAGDK